MLIDLNTTPADETASTTSNYTSKTARLPKTQEIKLHSENENYVKNAINRIGPTLDKICQDNHWHIDALKDRFDVKYYPAAHTFSRLINGDAKRKMTAEQLIELKRVSGISLDKLADGCDPFDFEQMTDARLVELVEQISAELARRIRQR